MNTYAEVQTTIEIRRDVPQSPAKTIHPDGAGGIVCDNEALRRKHAKAEKRAKDAWDARVAVHGGAPNDVYAANVALREAESARDEVNAELTDWLAENADRLSAEATAARVAAADRMLAELDAMEIELQTIARRDFAVALVKRKKSLADPFISTAPRRIAGSESLHNLRVGIRALYPSKPLEAITQAEHRRRAAAGESLEGTKITHSPDGWGPRGSELA